LDVEMTYTEQMIESKVERMIDRLDHRYLNGELSDSQYHEEMRAIDAWAEMQYSQIEVAA
jgi:hypothetical protein